jgi:hypothetical protein
MTVQTVNYSTLTGSTILAQAVNYSTLTGSTTTNNTMVVNSTLTGSTMTVQTVNYSTMIGSTMTINTLVIASTLTVSTLIATNNPAGVITSSMISLGASTNQSYTALAQGNYSTSTNWVSTLTNLVSTKIVAMSGNAQTQLAVTQISTISSIYYTSTLGISWSTISNVTGLPSTTQTNYSCGAVSGNGQYAALGTTNGYMYITSTLTSAAGPSFAIVNPITPRIYLPFDNSTADVYGNTVTTGSSTITYVTGRQGSSAAWLANTAGSTATFYAAPSWTGSSNFSITGYFYATAFAVATPILFHAYGGSVIIYLTNSGTALAGIPTGGAGGTATLGPSSALSINTWHSFVYIFQTNGLCSFYINNALVGSTTNSGGVGTFTTSSIYFGCSSSASNAFAGYIDDFKVYNSAIPYPFIYSNVALSNSGQYMLATVANGGLYMSSNFGSTWSQVTSVSGSGAWQGLAISATGQYMVAVAQTTNNAPVYSIDFGSNWNTSTFLGSAGSFIAISSSGQYCITGYTNTALIVSNYLAGFGTAGFGTSTYSTYVFLSGNTNNITGAAISQTGQYMVIVTNATSGANVYYSNNYGGNFTGLLLGTTAMVSCTMSLDGVYITVSNATTVYQLNNNSIGFSVAVGNQAGQQNQSQNAIAIGNQAGQQNQGQNAIAIGNRAGQINQSGNSIILNATGTALNSYYSGLYAAPIATYSALTSQSITQSMTLLGYGTDNQIVQSGVTFGTGTQAIYGEWIQYQLVTPVQISSYMLQQRQPGGPFSGRFPVAWIVVGSVDGINWVILDTRTGGTSSLWGTTYNLKATSNFYSYFRIIITQINSSLLGSGIYSGYYVDIGGFVLYNNSVSIIGAYTNYTFSGPFTNIVLYNSIPVCTVTVSMSSTTPNAFGITFGGAPSLGYIITSNGTSYTTDVPYASFYMYSPSLGAGEYNSSFIAFQGTATPVVTQPLIQVKDIYGNTQFQSTVQYPLDVNGIMRTQQLQFQDGTIQGTASNNQYVWTQAGLNWIKTPCPAANWYNCALSYSGQYQMAVANSGQMYVSANYGNTWTSITTAYGLSSNSIGWTWCAISSTGQYMTAGYQLTGTIGGIYLSSTYGQTWNYIQVSNYYVQALPMSASGQYMMAVPGYSGSTISGYIYISSNYGQTWTQTTQSFSGTGGNGAVVSGTGQYMLYVYNSVSYLSSTYGQTWSALSLASPGAIAISYSGQYIVISNGSSGVYISSNYGVSFSTNTTPTSSFYISMTSSGQYVFINTYNNGTIYLSTNYGATFSTVTTTNFANMYASGISGSGQYQMAVCTTSGFVYTSATPIYIPGNVGIGTTNPTAVLHVIGNINTSGNIIATNFASTDFIIGNVGTAYVPGKWLTLNLNYVNGSYPTSGNSITNSLSIGANFTNSLSEIDFMNNVGTGFNFYTRTAASTASLLMSMLANGNVGIGTSNPSNLLTVGASANPISNSAGTTNLVVNGNINCNRNRLIFSGTVTDRNHSIYNNFFNLDNEGVWDGMKFNVFNGAWFRVGNGDGAVPTTALYINSSGNIGIGTTNPVGAPLTTYNTSAALVSQHIRHFVNSNWAIWIEFGNAGYTAAGNFMLFQDQTGNTRGTITSSGQNTITYGVGSDRRIKNNINDIDNIRLKIQCLRPRRFKLNGIQPRDEEHYGFIAQEVQDYYPYLVSGEESETNILQLDYGKFSPFAIAGCKDLYIITDSIIAKNNQLEATIQQQAAEITALQSTIAQSIQPQVNAQQIQIAELMSQINQLTQRLVAAGIA